MSTPSHPPTETPRDAKARAKAEKAYKKAQRPWYKKKRFVIPLGLVVLIALISALGGGEDVSDSATTPSSSPTQSQEAQQPADSEEPSGSEDPVESEEPDESEEPVEPEESTPAAIEATAQEMIEALEGNALNARNTYENQRVTVSGFVGGIDSSGNYFALDPEPDAFILTGIQVQTSEEFLDQVAALSAGQEVTVTGTVTGVGEVLGYSIEAESIDQ
ncbi:OB-fold protein [uncultured Serinicoccus sp.]|uniref:OB-fold protein n=1 Tax=uncultured Serinicoccus sp. TaxID=735514 RepID=UPI0026304057|nr:hypothetical protein [uncultured Serinicoccus sp.]